MRYLHFPKDVDVTGLKMTVGTTLVESLGFSDFFIHFVLPRLPLNTSEGSDAALSLVEKISGMVHPHTAALTDKEHEAIQKTLASIQQALLPTVLVCMLPFFHAVNTATTEPPEDYVPLDEEPKEGAKECAEAN